MSLTNEDKDWIVSAIRTSEQRIDQRIDSVETTLRKEVADRADKTLEAVRDMQTEILRGLEAFSRGNFARIHRLESSDNALSERINALEERVLMLETRKPNTGV